jgi:hypothetical protein
MNNMKIIAIKEDDDYDEDVARTGKRIPEVIGKRVSMTYLFAKWGLTIGKNLS